MRLLPVLWIILSFVSMAIISSCGDNQAAPREMEQQASQEQAAPSYEFGLVIHGGAGTITRDRMTPEKDKEYRSFLRSVLDQGYAMLDSGRSSVDAVEACIRLMEDSPLFNAGKGAVFTHEGKNELDASIMEGKSKQAGAVAGVTNVRHPISAARKVMEASEHVMMAREGAESFAKEQGLEIVSPEWFKDDRRWEQLQKAKEKDKIQLDHDGAHDEKHGTVGVVALDREGNLAAGTSTGGMTNKRWGRIGDSPVIGAGTYADNGTCAISCTGHGEFFIRYVVAYDVAARMSYQGLSLAEAADAVIQDKLPQLGGSGGLIGIDQDGNIALSFNTEGMYRGYRRNGEKAWVGIYKDE